MKNKKASRNRLAFAVCTFLACRVGLPRVHLFLFFLKGLALDTERRDRPGLQALGADLLAAGLAYAVGAVLDPGDRLIDFLEQLLLPPAQAQREIAVQLGNGLVGRVGEALFFRADLAGQRALRFEKQIFPLLDKFLLD